MPDLAAVIARLPPGGAGVVFRHDGVPGRAALARRVARQCRVRRLALVIAGDARLAAAVGAGVHLRGGRRALTAPAPRRLVTASVHNRRELGLARRAGADIVFISPVFPTASHPGQAALGPLRWRALAAAARPLVAAALGGLTAASRRRLGPKCRCVGAISALLN